MFSELSADSAAQVLNSGEVPDLFAPDDLAKILDDLVPAARELNVPQTREQLYQVCRRRLSPVACQVEG
jgi:hypothetical protein